MTTKNSNHSTIDSQKKAIAKTFFTTNGEKFLPQVPIDPYLTTNLKERQNILNQTSNFRSLNKSLPLKLDDQEADDIITRKSFFSQIPTQSSQVDFGS